MKIGYYCPLVGEAFLKKIGAIPIDLRNRDYDATTSEFSQCGSNKCCLISRMSDLRNNHPSLDGLILTNCCHEQEQLVDFLEPVDTISVFKLNIPRSRSAAAVQFLTEQLEALNRQFSGNSGVRDKLERQPLLAIPKPESESQEGLFPIMVFGFALPLWLNGLLRENGLRPVSQEGCGFVTEEADIESFSAYAETLVYRSFCARSTTLENELLLPSPESPLPLAVLYIALEYCTTASYGFVKIRDFFAARQVPVFKIAISEWNKPPVKVVAQIESIAHICKEIKDESLSRAFT